MGAVTLYWDGDGAGTVGGGAGTWDQLLARWSTLPAGVVYQAWNNAALDDAWFANTAGAVSLGEPITARSVTARTNGYSLSGAALTLAGGTGQFDVGTTSGVTLTVNSVVDGAVGLTKVGAGGLTLNAANVYTGSTTLSAGTVSVGNNLALSSGSVVLAGGALAASGGARTLANAVTLGANSSISGSQALTLTGAVTLNGDRTLTMNSSALTTLSGGLAETGGARAFTKAGNGNLLLAAPSAYTGTTTITAGTLALGPAGTISNANLNLAGGVLALGADFTRGLGAGAGEVRFTTNGGFAAYGGPVNITGFAGTPVWGTTANFLANGRVLIFGSSIANDVVTWTNDFSLGGAVRTITANDNTGSTADRAVISGLVSSAAGGGLIKNGAGRLDLTGANTYTGTTALQGGVTGVTTLANVGAGASSLGAPVSVLDGTIALGTGTTSATLLYLGSGSTTDRVLNLAGTSGGAILQNDGTGALVFTSGVTATGAGSKTLTLTGSNTGANEIQGVIANNSGANRTAVTKAGAGVWELSGANTYTGNTTLSAGTLVAGNNAAFGTGTLVLSGTGAVLRGDGTPRTLANAVSLTQSMTLGGASDLTFTGNLTQSGGSRTLTVTNTGLTTLAGTVVLAENNQARTLTVSPGAGSSVVFSGVVQNGAGSGADNLTKSGAGTLTLSGANTYTGNTTLSAGTLVAGNNAAFGTGTLVLSGAGAVLRGDGTSRTLANAVTLSNSMTLGGASDLTLGGTVTQTGSRTLTVTNTGLTTLAGTVVLAENNQARTLTVSPGAGSSVVFSGVVQNGAGSGADNLTKSGAGTLTLSGANTYTGNTTLSAGTLVAGNNAAFGTGTLVLSGAGAELRGDGTPRTLANAVSLTQSMTLGGASDLTFTGNLTQSGGSRTLTVTNTGLTTLAGTVVLAENNQARTLTVSPGAGSTVVFSGVVQNGTGSGADGFGKTGAGTVVFSGAAANTFTGELAVGDGLLRAEKTGVNAINSSIVRVGDGAGAVASATLRLGAANQISDSADLVFRGDGFLDLNGFAETVDEIDSFAPGQGRIEIGSGSLTVGSAGGSSLFSGLLIAMAGGVFEKVGAGVLTLSDADLLRADRVMDFGGELRLEAGTLALDNITLNVETLRIGGTSILDFGGSSVLNVNNLVVDLTGGETLTINNWLELSDYLYAQNVADGLGNSPPFDLRGAAPLDRIVFASFSGNMTWWQTGDRAISPVPEPATYGLVCFAGIGAWLGLRRRRRGGRVTRS